MHILPLRSLLVYWSMGILSQESLGLFINARILDDYRIFITNFCATIYICLFELTMGNHLVDLSTIYIKGNDKMQKVFLVSTIVFIISFEDNYNGIYAHIDSKHKVQPWDLKHNKCYNNYLSLDHAESFLTFLHNFH